MSEYVSYNILVLLTCVIVCKHKGCLKEHIVFHWVTALLEYFLLVMLIIVSHSNIPHVYDEMF